MKKNINFQGKFYFQREKCKFIFYPAEDRKVGEGQGSAAAGK